MKIPGDIKLWRLYERGTESLDEDFEITKLIKGLRNMKIRFNVNDRTQLLNESVKITLS